MISDIGDMRFVRRLAPSLAALLLATACQPVASAGKASASPTPSPAGPPKHVFVIVLENTPYRLALRQPYSAGLANRYAVATNYPQISNPSLPTYLARTSGSTRGIVDVRCHEVP